MLRILLGIVIMAVGTLIIIKTEAMLSNFGRIAFFEKHLGTEGGSRMGYKIIGIIAIFIGIMIATNLIGGFLEWLLAPMIRYGREIPQ